MASKRLRVPGAARLAVGHATIAALDDNTSAIVARDETGFYALSATCTHACCTVSVCTDAACASPIGGPTGCEGAVSTALVRAGGAAFLCPCHGSAFAADGAVLNGPARDPLPAMALSFDGDDGVVDLSTRVSASTRL